MMRNDFSITSYPLLTDAPEEYVSQLEQLSNHSFFSSAAWYSDFSAEVSGSEGETAFLFLLDNQRVRAFLPIWIKKQKRYKLSVNAICGLSNYYTPSFDFLFDEENVSADAALQHFLLHIQSNYAWDYLFLSHLPEQTKRQWHDASNEVGLKASSYVVTENYYEDEIENFDQYYTNRPSRLKNTIKRKTNRLGKKEKDWEIIIRTDDDDIDKWIEVYNNIYNQSWKIQESHPKFIAAMIKSAAKLGILRLGFFRLEDEYIASQIWFAENRTAYIYKLAYIDNHKEFSAGTLLSNQLMKHCVEEDLATKVDFLTGSDSYKADWMSSTRKLYDLQLNSRSLKGKIISLLDCAANLKSKIIKR